MLAVKFQGGRPRPLGVGFTSERESNHVGLLRLLSRIWDAITSFTRPPNAATLFRRHADKDSSFTDCVSFRVMHEMRIRDAFTTDHHFKQAGFVPLLKA